MGMAMAMAIPFAILEFCFAALVAAQVPISPSASAAQAPGLSQVVVPSFAGMGIEPSNVFSYTGWLKQNDMSIQLFQNLAQLSGMPAPIRIGGNSQDTMLYHNPVDTFGYPKNPSPVAPGNFPADSNYFGNSLFEALNRLPRGTPIIFGLNMAYNLPDYLDRIVQSARQAITRLTNPTLVAFEIGNEPDLYGENGFRMGVWDGPTFVSQWLERAQAVANQVLTPLKYPSNFFEPATTASTIGKTFEINQLMIYGINKTANGTNDSYISSWNQHDYLYFIGVSTTVFTLDWLMNFDNTEAQFAYWSTQVAIALRTGYPYALREMASAGPTGIRYISDTFGASLWTLNFFLYAATLNISSVEIHMTDNSWAAPWQPVAMHGLEPYVRPSYYAFAAMGQLIGNCNGTARVAALDHKGDSNVRIYSVYANSELQSLVIINSHPANASSAATKGSITFTADLGAFKGQDLYLSFLTADGADSLAGTTWNGLSFSNQDGTVSGNPAAAATKLTVPRSGKIDIAVRNSQAVVANIGSVLGTTKVSPSDGSTDPARTSSGGGGQQQQTGGASQQPSGSLGALAGSATATMALLGAAATPSPNSEPKKGKAGSLARWHRDDVFVAVVMGGAAWGFVFYVWRFL